MTEPRLGAVGRDAVRACVWEATARKPGNVHRYADFDDLTYLDFVLSAAAIGPEMDIASIRPVGETILASVRATRRMTPTNTNLGIVLLLGPLAAAVGDRTRVSNVLDQLTVEDARLTYEAIRLAEPGGLGEADEQDIAEEPSVTLREAMTLAADRDSIARQYRDGFVDVFEFGVPNLAKALEQYSSLEDAIVDCHIRWLAQFPDSLIARKHGLDVAESVSRRADGLTHSEFLAFDQWLRDRRWNPGTTADLVAATLFVALQTGVISDDNIHTRGFESASL